MAQQNHSIRFLVPAFLILLSMVVGGFVTPVAAQNVDNVELTPSDTDGDGLPDRVEVNVTVSDVGTGQTIVTMGESDFDVDVSPTDTTDGNQAQFVTAQDPDGDGTNESVEFVEIGTADATYTVVVDLSDVSNGDSGEINVELGGGVTGSGTFTVTQAGDQSVDDTDGSGDGDNTTGGDDETDDGSRSDEGEQSDVEDGSGDSNTTNTTTNSDDTGGEGLPGFTGVLTVLALSLSMAYYGRSR